MTLRESGTFPVPRGVRHQPRAEEGTRTLLLEPRGTAKTGDAVSGEGTTGTRLA